jgi:uncharacterized protein (TIGR00369 family)
MGLPCAHEHPDALGGHAPVRPGLAAGRAPRHRARELGDGTALLRLPFQPELATMGEIVHGGAIAALLDTAGMAAAWADGEIPETLGGATVSMTVNYAAAAEAVDLLARATVVRRGRTLRFCEVTVTQPDGRVIAHGSMVHRYG